MVTLTPLFSFSLLNCTRKASRSVMSASSWLVTCGITTQLRCRLAPLIFLMRERSLRSTGPNLAKSTLGQGSRSRPTPEPPAAGAGAFAAWALVCAAPLITCLVKLWMSSWVMRPLGPVPLTSCQRHAQLARELAHRGAGVGQAQRGRAGLVGGGCHRRRSRYRGCSRHGGSWSRGGCGCGAAATGAVATGAAVLATPSRIGHQVAHVHGVTDLDLEFLEHASGGRRDLHRGFVGFDGEERLLQRHGVTGLDQQLDHGHVLEVANVGHAHFHGACGGWRRRGGRRGCRCSEPRAAAGRGSAAQPLGLRQLRQRLPAPQSPSLA